MFPPQIFLIKKIQKLYDDIIQNTRLQQINVVYYPKYKITAIETQAMNTMKVMEEMNANKERKNIWHATGIKTVQCVDDEKYQLVYDAASYKAGYDMLLRQYINT